jgi:hypothetical protein
MVKLKRTNQNRQMAVPMKRDEVSHDLISILSKSKWIEIQVITPNEL